MKACPTCGAEWSDDDRFCPTDGTPLRAAGAKDLTGTILGERYSIEKKIGEGAMGTVYLGKHLRIGAPRAIKVINPKMASNAEAIARFTREAANASQVSHPNICALHDFGETADGLVFLAMEYIDGESLGNIIRRDGILPPPRAAEITRQVASALCAAHAKKIVHRDLKPDNIMIAKTHDRRDMAKVVDFGIAKAAGSEGQNITRTDLVVGTPEYMSPEQLSGDSLDGRSDIYSLALVLFKMLTGGLPFEAETAQEVLLKRLTERPRTLDDALPGAAFPDGLQTAIDRALQRMPGDRYANADEFARDVFMAVMPERRLQRDDGSVRSRPPAADPSSGREIPPTVESVWPEPRPQRRTLWLVASIAGTVAIGGTAALVWSLTRPTPATQVENALPSQPMDTRSERPETTDSTLLPDPSQGAGVTVAPAGSTIIPPETHTLARARRPTEADAVQAINALMVRVHGGQAGDETLDSAISIHDNRAFSRTTRGLAAFVAANALYEADRRSEALQWAETALSLYPDGPGFRELVNALRSDAP